MKKLVLLFAAFFSFAAIHAQENQGKVSAVAFFDYTFHTNQIQSTNHEFNLKRTYLTYENSYSKELKYQFTLDGEGLTAGSKSDNKLFVKIAKVDYTTDFGTFIIGLQGMNMFSVQEKNWGYRFIEKPAMDVVGFSPSADLAVGYANKISDVNFSFIISNGTGFKKAEDDKFKRFNLALSYGEQNISSKAGYNLGVVASVEPYKLKDTEYRSVIGIFGGVSTDMFRVAAEGGIRNQKTMNDAMETSKAGQYYLSGNATVKFSPVVESFVRFDYSDVNTDVKDNEMMSLIGGVAVNPTKGLAIAPNLKLWKSSVKNSDTIIDLMVNFEFKL